MPKPGQSTKTIFTLVLSISFQICLLSQGWLQTYGGHDYDSAVSIVQTPDGGFITVGDSYSLPNSGTNDVYVVRLDSIGNVLWEKYFGGSSSDSGHDIVRVEDGYVIAGYAASFGGPSGYLLKIDESGTEIWARTFPKRIFRTIELTSDGGFIICADGWDETGNTDMYLIKTDAGGSPEWTKNFGGARDDYGRAALETSDGGFVITGEKRSDAKGPADVLLVKVDVSGNELWRKSYGGYYWDFPHDIQQTCDDGFIITGISDVEYSERRIYLVKTDKDGKLEWQQRFGSGTSDEGRAVQQAPDGGYLITGLSRKKNANDPILFRTDANGNLLWEKTYLSSSIMGYDILQTADGEYIIAGATTGNLTGDKGYEALLIKTDSLGVPAQECQLNEPDMELKIYPNPFHYSTTIELPGEAPSQQITFALFDTAGRLIRRDTFTGVVFDFAAPGLPTGIYFYQIRIGEKQTARGKLVIY